MPSISIKSCLGNIGYNDFYVMKVKKYLLLFLQKGYLSMAEKRTDAAKQESVDSVQDIDDLDNLATPEMILLSAVSGEDAQDRSDRKILMPWVKFLWESYCQCLELLRTNVRVERLYHDIAQQVIRNKKRFRFSTDIPNLYK